MKKPRKLDLPLGWELLMRTVKEIEVITKGGKSMKLEKKKGGRKGPSPAQGGTFWG